MTAAQGILHSEYHDLDFRECWRIHTVPTPRPPAGSPVRMEPPDQWRGGETLAVGR
jgi:redox-sensitive bicupin YhaK (pirin superfamily)